jgi:hypothetical protein
MDFQGFVPVQYSNFVKYVHTKAREELLKPGAILVDNVECLVQILKASYPDIAPGYGYMCIVNDVSVEFYTVPGIVTFDIDQVRQLLQKYGRLLSHVDSGGFRRRQFRLAGITVHNDGTFSLRKLSKRPKAVNRLLTPTRIQKIAENLVYLPIPEESPFVLYCLRYWKIQLHNCTANEKALIWAQLVDKFGGDMRKYAGFKVIRKQYLAYDRIPELPLAALKAKAILDRIFRVKRRKEQNSDAATPGKDTHQFTAPDTSTAT